jgi:signal transduction histidine kinase
VKDTGKGISKNNLSTIFDPFRQVDDSAIGRYRGSGLGLSIVNNLVNAMGGTISVASEIGVGSTFSISLPVVTKRQTKEDL